ncbi:MAG: DNA polymerase domain-containing protein [Candidatus Eremiobacteraeota bacterium]|nr:DNA polymerase domain-containing protein [Candidatus Eremiobacteraeota bacterium]
MKKPVPFVENRILFGHATAEALVAAEFDGKRGIELFFREGALLRSEKTEFDPFILVEDGAFLEKDGKSLKKIRLEGPHELRTLLLFPSWKEREKALKELKNSAGAAPGSSRAPFYSPPDAVHQFLLTSGTTLFKGFGFNDIVRMQLDIETWCDPNYEFPNAKRDSDRITAIALSDNRGYEEVLMGTAMDEAAMLREMVKIIKERDPDVIEGHNINKFDFPYIEERAKKAAIPLAVGRDGSALRSHPSRMTIAERNLQFPKYEIYGRHIVDTWILAQLYDVSSRSLESYGLKDIARHFNVTAPERTYIAGKDIASYFLENPETLRQYALDDVRETRSIGEILGYSFFLQAQMVPFSYQNTILRGNATKIDSLFLREYLRRRHSIPLPPEAQTFPGGYADIFTRGLIDTIIHCDVQSLYPSLMLAFRLFPGKDHLGVFESILSDLKAFRLEAKALMREASQEGTRNYYEALQGTFKILINSFYGYLGFPMGHFSDYAVAAQVTARGRDLLSRMIENLKGAGCTIAEIDTDGIYFSPPPGGEAGEKEFMAILSRDLPPGITVEIDGTYKAMFSYKVKNYVLLGEDGTLTIKGSGLKSRGLERFQRKFMEELFLLLLQGGKERIEELYQRYRAQIAGHQLPIEWLCKTETLQDSLQAYQEKVREKKRNASAAYELALQSAETYSPGDQISYYVTGTGRKVKVFDHCAMARKWRSDSPDENVPYYLEKLDRLYEKFKPFIDGTFQDGGEEEPEES